MEISHSESLVLATLKVFFYFFLLVRLALYYLNAVSKAYQQANLDLKKKMQMVSREESISVRINTIL